MQEERKGRSGEARRRGAGVWDGCGGGGAGAHGWSHGPLPLRIMALSAAWEFLEG